jgi:DNA-binding response OmpR family regulator
MATNKQPHILVVDDEPLIRSMLGKYLVEEGYRVSGAGDGDSMRAVLEHEQVDLVLLDLMIPGEDGLSLARHIRQRSDVPIIIVTARHDLIDRVAGLEAGADDYIEKPFHLREILARIRTVMRRAPRTSAVPLAIDGDGAGSDTFVFSGWLLDVAKRELRANGDGTVVPLTAAEFDLLIVFVRHPNRILNRNQLMDFAKGREWAASDRAIDSQVVRLRRKIERDPSTPELIKTVRGAGYLLTAQVTAL